MAKSPQRQSITLAAGGNHRIIIKKLAILYNIRLWISSTRARGKNGDCCDRTEERWPQFSQRKTKDEKVAHLKLYSFEHSSLDLRGYEKACTLYYIKSFFPLTWHCNNILMGPCWLWRDLMVKPEPRNFPPGSVLTEERPIWSPLFNFFKQLFDNIFILCSHGPGGFLVLSWSWILFVAIRALSTSFAMCLIRLLHTRIVLVFRVCGSTC